MTHPPLQGFATGSRRRYSTPTGLDWDAIRADYREACSPEELEATLAKPVSTPKQPSIINTPTGSRAPTRSRSSAPKTGGDTPSRTSPETEARVCQLYRDGTHILEVGQTTNLHRTTVRRILVEADLWKGTGPQHTPGHAARMAKLAANQ